VRAILPRRGSEFPLKGHLNYRFQYQVIASGLIVNSRATAQTLCRDIDWTPRGRVHVLYNGVDLTPFDSTRPRVELRRELGLSNNDLALIQVGELTTRKNAALAVSALPRFDRRVHLLLVGEGPEESSLRELASTHGVAERAHFLGFREDVPSLLTASDVLVHCARVEGFGFAVAEGGAAGIPAVAANASSVPEIIVDGETGALFESDDVDDLVRALQPYLTDADLRAAHGQAGRRRVESTFELQQKMDGLEALFEAELARP
jgi:glycosyltransferase involved in cell wall biosynthesis